MKVKLENSLAFLEINSNGAYVDNYEVKGEPVFFPKVMVKIGEELKVRGGMHICAPNFAYDNIYNELPNHGFARDLAWQIIENGDNIVKLSLDGIGLYQGFKFFLTYRLERANLFSRLSIINQSEKPREVAPGFHPYFYADKKPIILNNMDIEDKDLPNSVFNRSKSQKFLVNGKDVEIIGNSNINEFVFWTDFMGDYICVEPTYNAMAFADDSRDSYMLDINECFSQEIEIRVNI